MPKCNRTACLGLNKEIDLEAVANTHEYLSWRRLHKARSKLSIVAEMAFLMAAFAVRAATEMPLSAGDASPQLITIYVITTSLLVAISMISIIIATYVLPDLDMLAKTSLLSEFYSPHDTLGHLIDLSWILTSTACLFLFTLDLIFICWIKFTKITKTAPICATIILTPVLLAVCLFGIIYSRRVMQQHYIIARMKCEELEMMQVEIERMSSSGSSRNSRDNLRIKREKISGSGKGEYVNWGFSIESEESDVQINNNIRRRGSSSNLAN